MLGAVFAQGEVAGWAGVGAVLINAGFAAFVAWYLLTKALPKSQAEFTKALREVQDRHDQWIEGHRAEVRDALKSLIDQWERDAKRRDEHFRIEMGLFQKELQDHGEILEQVRDWIMGQRGPRRPPRPPTGPTNPTT